MMTAWVIVSVLFAGFAILKHVPQMRDLFFAHKKYVKGNVQIDPSDSMGEMVAFAKEYYKLSPSLEYMAQNTKDVFLREALMAYLGGAVRGHDMLRALRTKADEQYKLHLDVIVRIQNMTKFLPAIGWVAALASAGWIFSESDASMFFYRAVTVFPYLLGAVVYGLSISYFIAEPTAHCVAAWAKIEREKNLLLIESLAQMIKKKSVYEWYETVNLTLPTKARDEMSQQMTGETCRAA